MNSGPSKSCELSQAQYELPAILDITSPLTDIGPERLARAGLAGRSIYLKLSHWDYQRALALKDLDDGTEPLSLSTSSSGAASEEVRPRACRLARAGAGVVGMPNGSPFELRS